MSINPEKSTTYSEPVKAKLPVHQVKNIWYI